MKLPEILEGVPRIAVVLAIPLVAFLVTIGVSLGRGGGSNTNNTTPGSAGVQVALSQTQAAPTATSAPAPSATAAPNRADCKVISASGTYQSDTERDWYLKNCTAGATATASAGSTTRSNTAPSTTTGGGGGSTTPSSSSSTQGVAAPPVSAGQAPIGDRLVIPSIGVNADVWRASVDASGNMPDPTGYFNAVWYDFSAIPGAGGYIGKGNTVLAGHVDCARCNNGGPGLAVFYYTRNMAVGDRAQYYTADGKVFNFVVTLSADYTSASDWGYIVSSGTADMTLITCGGVFDPVAHEYNLRHVVALKLI